MLKMEQKNTALIISLVALISALGIPITENMFDNELSNYYVCPLDLDVQEFDRLSSTEQRGYPYEGSTKGYKDCKTDVERNKWQKLSIYAKENGIDPYSLIITKEEVLIPSNTQAKRVRCNMHDGCWEI